jgi:hypothetical protein
MAEPITEAQLQALAAQHGGEKGRYVYPGDEKIPRVVQTETGSMEIPGLESVNPEPRYIVEFGDGRRAVIKPRLSAPDQYDVLDMPAPPSAALAGPKADIYNLPGRGLVRINPDGTATAVEGGQLAPSAAAGSWQSGTYYGGPDTPIPEALRTDPLAIEKMQQDYELRAAAENRLTGEAQERAQAAKIREKLDSLKIAMDLHQMDAKEAQQEYDNWWKREIELPQKQFEAEQERLGKGIEYGRQVGEAAVKDVTDLLPYRYSPGFLGRRENAFAEAGRGNFLAAKSAPLAQAYRGPDLAQTRAAAQSGGQRFYEQQFGFEPLEVAGQIPYRAPVPAAAGQMAAPGVSDDEEVVKQLARRLAGGM